MQANETSEVVVNPQISVRLGPDLRRRAEAIAKAKGVSLADVIRMALNETLPAEAKAVEQANAA